MFGACECICGDDENLSELYQLEPQPFSLPSPLPNWPQGKGFATGRICLGEIEVAKVTKFRRIWNCKPSRGKGKGVAFYRPVEIPDGFFSLGHYCQSNGGASLRGYVLVAREVATSEPECNHPFLESPSYSPALEKPLGYTLICSNNSRHDGVGYIWMPNAPDGYKAMGFVVTTEREEPEHEEVRCVRSDLTQTCETCDVVFDINSTFSKYGFCIWNTRPCKRGIWGRGVPVGTFFCSGYESFRDDGPDIACLKNFDSTLHGMPNLNQIHALIKQYGPTVFFHPDDVYLPSSVSWFFKNGALLYRKKSGKCERIDYRGSNLPRGGENDSKFWIDLPDDEHERDYLKRGNIESAELYVHVKPAQGGTFTDIVMWVFCPFNGPATLKAGVVDLEMSRVGEHVSDWEHFTLRLSNFTGELWSVYFSQHSGGEWVDACELEFIEGNKPVVYSSKSGHASFAHPGCYIQGSSKLGIGVRNDAARSKFFVDSSTKYRIVAAEYLGDDGAVEEPDWLQYMREWGPTIKYDARSEIDKIINRLPFFFRFSVESLVELFPNELYGEEGPTGPKEKNNWVGDERW